MFRVFLINVVNYTFGGLLTIGAGIKIIYQQCFKGATATSLTLEEGIEEIQGTAFRDFKVYGDLILPSTTKIVGQGAFQNATFNG